MNYLALAFNLIIVTVYNRMGVAFSQDKIAYVLPDLVS
jgi:hypothetical protein